MSSAKNLRTFAAAVGLAVGVVELLSDFANIRYLAPMLGGTGNAAAATLVIAVLHIGAAAGIYFRKRTGWLIGVALSGAAIIPVIIVGMTMIVQGLVLEALPAMVVYATLLAAQIACYEEMEPSPWPHVEGAIAGGVTAVLWLVAGLENLRWSAIGHAAFGHDVAVGVTIVAVALQVGLSFGIYKRSRAAWGFAMSLAGTMCIPLAIGVVRLMFQKEFFDGAIALFAHTTLMTVQAVALDDAGITPSRDAAKAAA